VTAALLLALLLQQQGEAPQVMLAIDRDRVAPGDVVTFTIRITSTLADPIRMEQPSLGGFDLESRSDRSDVTTGPGGGRVTTIQLKLRATTPGEWRLGPVAVRQGIALAQSDPVTVTITGGAPAPVTASMSQRLARILSRASPPGGLGPAGISVMLSDEDVSVGEQVDVVTIAWFERGLRQQLRRAPTVESPHIEGVWSYPQPVPGGIAASRQVGGKWYDLFVLHQVVFPLTPGRVAGTPAHLQYTVPLSYQFFSQEESYKLESAPLSFLANPLPAEGRDPAFAGAVGRGLEVSETVTPGTGKQGEAFTAEIRVRGEGNVALWPQPDLRWPPVFRVYPEGAHEQLTALEGRLSGTKTFTFLLIADSAGALALPPVRYAYFDIGTRDYRVVQGGGALIVVAPRGEAVNTRVEPPPIRLGGRRPLALAMQQALPAWAWWIIMIVPALVLLALRLPRRRRPPATAIPADDPLRAAAGRLAHRLTQGGLHPDEEAALRALAGRVEAMRFAPLGDYRKGALLQEAEALLERLRSRPRPGAGRWRQRVGMASLLLLGLNGSSRTQTQPEQLYEAGAYRAAAEGFRRRALDAPGVPNHWFNLGDAAYRAGDDATSLVGWVRAARLSPRDVDIRRALQLVAPADPGAANSLWVAPLTPPELWLLGLISWLVGWAGILWTRQIRGRWVVLLAGGALLLLLSAALARWYAAPLAVVGSNEQLRLSPHELAPAVSEVSRLGTVRLGPARGGWIRVDAGAGQRGWMRREGLQPIAGEFPR
jgi:hypothetical protein